MNNIFKRLEVLATNSRANNFKGAVIRLTAYYTLGVSIILGVFSVVVFTLFSSNIENQLNEEAEQAIYFEHEEPLLHDVTEHLFDTLVVSDGILLILTLIVSYGLARKTLAPLAESYQRQQQFVADAAHELRTPLSVIKAGSELLLQHDRTQDQYKTFITESHEEIDRLIRLSNDLLFLAHHSEKKNDAHDVFSLSELCENQVQLITPYALSKHVHLKTNVALGMCITGKQDDIARLILNLLKNAIDYNVTDGEVALTLSPKNSKVVLTVSDTGIGISAENIPHIFDRFYKADLSRTQKHTTGSGLGLAIVQEIASQYRGEIQVHSTLQKGTVFEVQFPCA